MIICEGPDGSGKSTLTQMLEAANVIDKVLPSPRIAAKSNTARMKYETERYFRLHGQNQRIAVDRLLFSEMAYGPVLRGNSTFSMNEYFTSLLEIRQSGSFVIFCLPEKLNYKTNESPVIIEKMPMIRARYELMFKDFSHIYPRVVKYEWDKPRAFLDLIDWIEENKA